MWQGQIDITAGQMRFCVTVLLAIYSMLVKSVYEITVDKIFSSPLYKAHAFEYCLLVGRYEVVVTLGERFFKPAEHIVERNQRFQFEQGAEQYHVVSFRVAELNRGIHGVDFDDINVGARGIVMNAVWVVDEGSARLDAALEFVEALPKTTSGKIMRARIRSDEAKK